MFTKEVRDVHRALAPHIPIAHFVEALEPAHFGLANREQFYAPISFGVQISGPIGGAAGAIRVNVPVHANADGWLDLMKRRFARMISMPQLSVEEMEFRTVTGKSLATIALDQLPRVGKLNLFVQGELLRLPEVPPIPVEYSANKMHDIASWIAEHIEQALPDQLSRELNRHASSAATLEAALLPEGPVQRLVESAVMGKDAAAWTEFVRTRHMHSPEEMSVDEATKTAKQIARDALVHLRALVEAAAPQIKEALGAQESARAAAALQKKAGAGREDAHLYAPLLGNNASSSSTSSSLGAHSIPHLMESLSEETCASPALHKAIASALHTRALPTPIGDGCRWAVKNRGARGSGGAGGGGGGGAGGGGPMAPKGSGYSSGALPKSARSMSLDQPNILLAGDQPALQAYAQWYRSLLEMYEKRVSISEIDVLHGVRNFLIESQAIAIDTAFVFIERNTLHDSPERLARIWKVIGAVLRLDLGSEETVYAVDTPKKVAMLRTQLAKQGLPIDISMPAIPNSAFNNFGRLAEVDRGKAAQQYRYVRPRIALSNSLVLPPRTAALDAEVERLEKLVVTEIEAARAEWKGWFGTKKTGSSAPSQTGHVSEIQRLAIGLHQEDSNALRYLAYRLFSAELLKYPVIGFKQVADKVFQSFIYTAEAESPYYDYLAELRPRFDAFANPKVTKTPAMGAVAIKNYLEQQPSTTTLIEAALRDEGLEMQEFIRKRFSKTAISLHDLAAIIANGGVKPAATKVPSRSAPKVSPPPTPNAPAPSSPPKPIHDFDEWEDNLKKYAEFELDLSSEDDLSASLYDDRNLLSNAQRGWFRLLLKKYADEEGVKAAGGEQTEEYWALVASTLWSVLTKDTIDAVNLRAKMSLPPASPGIDPAITEDDRMDQIREVKGTAAKVLFHSWRVEGASITAAEARQIVVQIIKSGFIVTATTGENKENWTIDDVKALANLVAPSSAITLTKFHKGAIKNSPAAMDAENIIRNAVGVAPLKSFIGAHHPFNAQIHSTLQPLTGAYPAYYNVLHTKQDMSKDAPYAGDLAATYAKYHAFAGVPQMPTLAPAAAASAPTQAAIPKRPPTKPIGSSSRLLNLVPAVEGNAAPLQLVECGHCGGKKKPSRKDNERYDNYSSSSSGEPIGCRSNKYNEDPDEDLADFDDEMRAPILVGCCTGNAPNAAAARKSSKPRSGGKKTTTMRAPITAAPIKKKLPGFEDIFL